ncbi:MAG TPA: hypothetical protein VFA08_10420 [Actinomycetota bacterium]|jgi:hypothetical protein|nr:hypothetical protein [Actinomycetota bacterium]
MRKAVAVSLVALFVLAVPAVASAGDRDVIREGPCSGRSDWKLKLSPENGRIEVEFEVDQNVVGDEWRVRIRHDGQLAFRGTRTTRGASGSFELRIVEPNHAGADNVRARARNLSTDEVCAGSASF